MTDNPYLDADRPAPSAGGSHAAPHLPSPGIGDPEGVPEASSTGERAAAGATADPYATAGAPAGNDPYAQGTAGQPWDPPAGDGPYAQGAARQPWDPPTGVGPDGSVPPAGTGPAGAGPWQAAPEAGFSGGPHGYAGGTTGTGGYQQSASGGQAWGGPAQPTIQGVYEGPITGVPVSTDDEKLWAMLAQLSAIIGYVVGAGTLGWLGPLVIFLVYKDRSRFVRYNAAESLNAAIATFLAEIVLGILFTIFAVVTLGFGVIAMPIVFVPAVLHVVFAIIGAVKANRLEWWNYPINIRFVK